MDASDVKSSPASPFVRAPASPAQLVFGGRFGRGAQPPSERITRRQFLGVAGSGAALLAGASIGGCAGSMKGDFMPKTARRVVVIGGGWGGATAAKYLRTEDPAIEVVLLEPNRSFVSCPVQQPRAERSPHHREHHVRLRRARQARRQARPRVGHRHRARPPARARRRGLSRVRPAGRLARRRLSVGPDRGPRPEPGQGPARVEGRSADGGPGQADPVDGRRRRLRPHHSARSPIDARPAPTSGSARWPGTSSRTSRGPR